MARLMLIALLFLVGLTCAQSPCPTTITQTVISNVTSTETSTATITWSSKYRNFTVTAYNATTTATTPKTVVTVVTVYTSTAVFSHGFVIHTVLKTYHNPGKTTKSICSRGNRPPKGYPTPCKRIVETTITETWFTEYPPYSNTYEGTVTVTAPSTVYPKTVTTTSTAKIVSRSDTTFFVSRTVNITKYARTVTILGPLRPTPNQFKLEIVDSEPSCYDIDMDGAYLKEEQCSRCDVPGSSPLSPGLFPHGNNITGSIFNLTRLNGATVLGRPGANSTCGANTYDTDLGYEIDERGYEIACPKNSNGWDPNDPMDYDNGAHTRAFLELQKCYMDCFSHLRCAIGTATEFYIGVFEYLMIGRPYFAREEAWEEFPGRLKLKVVAWPPE